MSEKEEVDAASTLEGPTAAEILEQINEKQRELNAQVVPVAPEPALIPEPVPSPSSVEPTEPIKPAEPAPESGAGAAPGPTPGEGDKPDWKKWIEKKGFKSQEDMVRSMRELERELHRRASGQGANAPQPGYPAQSPQMPPVYVPPVQPSPSEEEVAKRYNMDPEDLRRVGPLAADIAANITAQRLGPLQAELNRLNREVARGAELQGLKEDSVFSDPRVQFEMHKLIESNPSILQNEPAPWRYAFNEALRTMGRRILEESTEVGVSPKPVSGPLFPTTPPKTAGGSGAGAGGGGGIKPPGHISASDFAKLPSAEQRKILVQLGAAPKED